MDILLSVSRSDAKCRLFNKGLLEYAIKNLKINHKIYIYAPKVDLSVYSDDVTEISAKSEMEALADFSCGRDNFMFISRLALCNINFENLAKYHINHDKSITVVSKNFVKDKTIPIYKLNENKEVVSVTRKRFADCGIYLFKSGIQFDGHKNIFSVIFDAIDNKQVKGFVHKGYWCTSYNVRRRNNGQSFNAN